MKVLPYHTTSMEYPPSHRNVYHDHRECHYGRHILPQDRVAALRKAFTDTMKDSDFLADANKGNFEIRPVSGADIQKLIAEIYETPPAVAQKTVRLLQ